MTAKTSEIYKGEVSKGHLSYCVAEEMRDGDPLDISGYVTVRVYVRGVQCDAHFSAELEAGCWKISQPKVERKDRSSWSDTRKPISDVVCQKIYGANAPAVEEWLANRLRESVHDDLLEGLFITCDNQNFNGGTYERSVKRCDIEALVEAIASRPGVLSWQEVLSLLRFAECINAKAAARESLISCQDDVDAARKQASPYGE